jgi:hypothetical protein
VHVTHSFIFARAVPTQVPTTLPTRTPSEVSGRPYGRTAMENRKLARYTRFLIEPNLFSAIQLVESTVVQPCAAPVLLPDADAGPDGHPYPRTHARPNDGALRPHTPADPASTTPLFPRVTLIDLTIESPSIIASGSYIAAA